MQTGKSNRVRSLLKKAKPSQPVEPPRKKKSFRVAHLFSSEKEVCRAEDSDKIVLAPGRMTQRATPLDHQSQAGLEVATRPSSPSSVDLSERIPVVPPSQAAPAPHQHYNLRDYAVENYAHNNYLRNDHAHNSDSQNNYSPKQSISPVVKSPVFSFRMFVRYGCYIVSVFTAIWLYQRFYDDRWSTELIRSAPSIKIDRNIPVIAIMGASGAGKSSFIRALNGRDQNEALPEIGHGLQSCTKSVGWYSSSLNGQKFYILDTPGFDDVVLSDSTILQQLAKELVSIYQEHRPLAGLIYLYDISRVKMGRASKSLETFHQLVGDGSLKNVILATTHWPPAKSEYSSAALKREKELQFSFWKHLISKGSPMCRHDDSKKSAEIIVGRLLGKTPVKVQIVDELVDKRRRFDQTAAGKVVDKDLAALRAQAALEINAVKQQLKSIERARRKDAARHNAERESDKREREQIKERLQRERKLHKEGKAEIRREQNKERLQRERKLHEEERKAEIQREQTKERLQKERKLHEERKAEIRRLQKKNRDPIIKPSRKTYSPPTTQGPVRTMSGFMRIIAVLSWTFETFCVVSSIIVTTNGNSGDGVHALSVLYSVYWGLLSYLIYTSGHGTLSLFIVVCTAIFRLLFMAHFFGFISGVKEGHSIAMREYGQKALAS